MGRPKGSHSNNVFAKSVANSLINAGFKDEVVYSALKDGFSSLAGSTSAHAHSRAIEVLTEVLQTKAKSELQNDLATRFSKISGESFVPAKPRGRKASVKK